MTQDIPGTLLLDPKVMEDPYPFYRELQMHAPVWQVPGTEVFIEMRAARSSALRDVVRHTLHGADIPRRALSVKRNSERERT